MALSFVKNKYGSGGTYVSERVFFLIMSATLFFGFAVNAVEVLFFSEFITNLFNTWGPVIFFVVYFVSLIVGVIINALCNISFFSFVGYCMVVLPIGAMLTIVLPEFSPTTVASAFLATSLITLVMVLLAIVKPEFFEKAWKIISVCLLVALVWSMIALFTPFHSSTVWIDWLVIGLFSLYIGVDICIARSESMTLDNAVDAVCGLYLNIFNLFIYILSFIAGNGRD